MAIISAWVVGPADHALVERDDHRPDRHLAFLDGAGGFLQGHLHVPQVQGMPGIAQRRQQGRVKKGPVHALMTKDQCRMTKE